MELTDLTLTQAAAAIESRELSPVDLVEVYLARVDEVDAAVGAFECVLIDEARQEARAAANDIARGRHKGPLHGIPVSVKDIYDTEGVVTTCSSEQRADHVPDADADVVSDLRRAGAVVIGKTRLDEFAFGGVTPGTSNPWDLDRIPGGSSGGAAAAVAAGECLLAWGTDTGGSLRIPSAFCGTVGLKPTYGVLSRGGIAPLSWSLDHAGPIARNVRDVAMALEVMVGHDEVARARDVRPLAAIDRGVDDLVIGVPTNFFFDRVDADVEALVRDAISALEAAGARLREVELPLTALYLPVEWGILLPEASTYHQATLRSTPQKYTEAVRAFLEVGELIPATDYIRAQRARAVIKDAWRDMFRSAELDVVVSPTVPLTAPLQGQDEVVWDDGTAEPLVPLLGRSACAPDVTGQPAISVPCGLSGERLPVGLEFIGRPFDEETVIRAAAAWEAISDWSNPHTTGTLTRRTADTAASNTP